MAEGDVVDVDEDLILDNYEWGRYGPTFGLVAGDRTTFGRTAKRSAHWLGDLARRLRP